MKQDNPFMLMFGKSPNSIIQRHAQYGQIIDTFSNANPPTYAYLITGIRGSGKTVMMRLIAQELARKEDWIVLDCNSLDEDLIQSLSQKLLHEGGKTKLFNGWSLSINAKLFTLNVKNEDQITNPEVIFERLLQKANGAKKRILITIDEVSATPQMKRFANTYQSMIGKDYEVFLLMTGLKENVAALVGSDTSSFLSRTPKIDLLPLDEADIAEEYGKILNLPFPKAAALAKLTKGYAFGYQVLGYLCYERGNGDIDEELLLSFDRYMRINGYDVIWKDMTKQEQNFCFALANSEKKTTSEVAALANMKGSNFQNYRGKLIEKGIIEASGYGELEFSLPRFSEFVKKVQYLR